MSHYDDQYEERDRKEYERKRMADESRDTMMNIPVDDMIKIMFRKYLKSLSDFDAIQLKLDYHDKGVNKI